MANRSSYQLAFVKVSSVGDCLDYLPDGFLPFARVARLFVFAHRPRTKTRATRVNFKKWPILNSKGYLCLLNPRKVEMILSDMVFAMKIFARVARVARAARVSDLATQNVFDSKYLTQNI